jgi:tetratricopeptide (TPR) repeat protein
MSYQQALDLFNQGNLKEAESSLRSLLEAEPDNAATLCLLATILMQQVDGLADAEKYMVQAIDLLPDNLDLVNNLGSIYWAQHRFDDAIECFKKVNQANPKHVDAWHNLGKCYQSKGFLSEAEFAFNSAFDLNSQRLDILESLAMLLFQKGESQKAIDLLTEGVEKQPNYVGFHANLALAYQSLGDNSKAIECYNAAIELNPKDPRLFNNLGQLYRAEKRFDEASRTFGKAIALDSKFAAAYNNLGLTMMDQELIEPAKAAFKSSIRLDPNIVATHLNLGMLYRSQQQYDLAKEEFDLVLEKEPNTVVASYRLADSEFNLGNYDRAIELQTQLIEQGLYLDKIYAERGNARSKNLDWYGALSDYNKAIYYRPDDFGTRFNRAVMHLKLGNFELGWQDYEWRFTANNNVLSTVLSWDQPEWDGQPFHGKTLLVHHEQGLGDALHFSRYLKLLEDYGDSVVINCGPPLFRLFEKFPIVKKIVSRKERDSLDGLDYDLQVPLMSLPKLFRTNEASIPNTVPYLEVDEALVNNWKDKLIGNTFKVGLVWEGNPDQGDNDHRSCSLDTYAPLAEIPGITFVSLQVGRSSVEAKSPPKGMELLDYTDELTDLADTAALIENLDLVVTIDTSVAHLAGALGKPVWVILWTNCCWRYLLDRDDSPWYPSMKLFRQTDTGDWSQPINQLKQQLELLVR